PNPCARKIRNASELLPSEKTDSAMSSHLNSGVNQLKVFQFSLSAFTPELKWLLIALSVFSLGNSSDAFLILRAQGLGMSLTFVILAYVLYNVIYMLLSTPGGKVSDMLGAKRVMIVGILIYALVYIGFALDKESLFIWPL